MFSGGPRDGEQARRPLRLALLLLALALLAGCRSNQKSSLVEAELRTRERELRATRDELQRSQVFNEALVREFHDRVVCPPPVFTPAPQVTEGPSALMGATIKQITLARGTGGLDDDGVPGD